MRGWFQFDAAKDLRPQPHTDVDSYYIVSHASDDRGHSFTVLFHVFLIYKPAPRAQVAVSVLDETTLDYLSQVSVYTLEEIRLAVVAASNDMALEIRTPRAVLNGPSARRIDAGFTVNADGMSVLAICPGGKCRIAMTHMARGHILPNLVTGVIPFANGINYEYAFPTMETEGEIVFNDKTFKVHGTSWFDREWGSLGPTKWTWMAIGIDGIQISLWDQQSHDNPRSFAAGERAFATLLYPDGSVTVASVTVSETEMFESSKSHQFYANTWSVSIPSQQLVLKLKLLRKDQEIVSDPEQIIKVAPRIEGKAAVDGTHKGKHVAGTAIVEMFNLFPLFAAALAPLKAQAAPDLTALQARG
jgi:hypothetical protein